MIETRRDGVFHVLSLEDGHEDSEHRMGPAFVERFEAALTQTADTARAEGGDAALVVEARGKFFSNGLDLEALAKLPPDELAGFSDRFAGAVARLLTLPIPTVAAINGHAFAGGAILALACDYRVMRADRGWICLSEVDAGVPLTPGLSALVRGKLPPATARDAVLLGKRFTADEAIAGGFADAKADLAELGATARRLVEPLAAKGRAIFSSLKETQYGEIAARLAPAADAQAGALAGDAASALDATRARFQ